MIESRVLAVDSQEVADWLGDGGEERVAVWPAITVGFVVVESGEVVSTCTYLLRDRSAIQTIDDVTACAVAEAERLTQQLVTFDNMNVKAAENDGATALDLSQFVPLIGTTLA